MKRLLLLADAGNVHTAKWASEFARRDWDVHVLSLRQAEIEGAEVHWLRPPQWLKKTGYLAVAPLAGALARKLSPRILHAHYATSYGFLGTVCHVHPFVISVWGSDVYCFPKQSPLHRALLEYNLKRADLVTSTSCAMATETALYLSGRPIETIPFGVDLERFAPGRSPDSPVIGCAKMLEPIYGQQDLLLALHRMQKRVPDRPWQLMLAGDGSQRAMLEQKVMELGLSKRVHFLGKLPHSAIPDFLRGLSLFAMPSYSESFGVAAVEAAACGLPVIGTKVGGIAEVVQNGISGILVPPNDPYALSVAIEQLLDDPKLRAKMGAQGRALAESEYDWKKNADTMEAAYERLMARR